MAAKVSARSSGGAGNHAGNRAIVSSASQLRRGTGHVCFTCNVCFVLSLICAHLATLLILLDQKVEAASDQQPVTTMSAETIPDLSFRLPREVTPLHYDLYLHPDLENGTFQGRVTIMIDVLKSTSYIALHQKDLNITSTTLKTCDLKENYEFEVQSLVQIPKYEMFVVPTKKELHTGCYNLSFEFDGTLKDKIVGFYLSKYKDAQNETRHIATSKFEPTNARKAFPCFDEPDIKAEFTIKLVHPSSDSYGALSNMNVKCTDVDQPSQGLTTVTFAKSERMPTYSLCFIVSDFVSRSKIATSFSGLQFPVSVYTTKAQEQKGEFALDLGVKIIEYYVDYLRVEYLLPKLDMVAIPDFVSGAMENWGLVTYREARLLFDNETSSTAKAYDIVTIISHEFAHMWFGNLVTIAWWDDLWLNEGFASFMQYKCADAILPDWGMMDLFLIEQMHSVFITDSKLSSHPIVQTVNNPDEITAIFDEISYKKGSSLIRMMETFVTPEKFRSAMYSYLDKFKYKNVKTADLLKALDEVTPEDLNVTAIMDTWLRQKGFPVVNVKKSGDKYVLTQKRFLADPEAEFDRSESEYGYKWTIPITYITNKTPNSTLVWFDKDAENLVIEFKEPVDWIKFNADEIGYYRVNYEPAEWNTLGNLLQSQHKTLSVSDRAHLLEDVFSLASAGELDYEMAMNTTEYLPQEKHAIPWDVAASKLAGIDTLLSSTNTSSKFKKYVRDLVHDTYHEVGWNVSSNDDRVWLKLRTTILRLACSVEHEECLEKAGSLFKSWIEDSKDVRPHADIRDLVYYYGMHHVGDEAAWNAMFDKFVAESDSTEKLKLMRGLAGIQSTLILNKFIVTATDENYVRSQDFFGCLTAISENPVGTPLIWDWVRSNWDFLVNRYTLNDRYLGSLIPAITKTFATEAKLNEMKAFFAKYPDAGAGAMNRAKALETVSNNIRWLAKNSGRIESWLTSHT